jgi:hypothetical protein
MSLRSGSGKYVASLPGMPITDIDPTDLNLIETEHPNLLICGPHDSVDSALAVLQPTFREPVSRWGHYLQEPLPQQLAGTLIVESATSLDDEQQKSLIDWLNDDGRQVQVIATTPENLFPFAAQGVFRDRLFYRLNTLHLDVGCPN